VQALLTRSLAILLLGACAAPPRAERLAALEQRARAQRARSQEVEREIGRVRVREASVPPQAGIVPYYEIVSFRTSEPLDARYEPGLRLQLAQALAESAARSFEYSGVDAARRFEPPWPGQEFSGVPVAALFAAAHAGAPKFRGAEFDVRVPLEPGPARRVTAIHEVDGHVRAIDVRDDDPPQPEDGPPAEVLRSRYGIGPIEGWSARERAALERALELLRPAERALLAGLPFRRKRRGESLWIGSDEARHCGHFALEQEERSITMYDCAFATDRHAFVGPLDRPIAPSVRIVLHEIAHALSAARLGDLLAGVSASQREARQMVDEFNRLGRSVPPDQVARIQELQDEIEKLNADLARWHSRLQGADQLGTAAVQAFLEVPGARSGFTPYGRTNPAEAFAEAFSVCRTDPEAGRRISPQACAFFESDAYLDSGT
jgi:hypothetical protein